MNLFLIVLEGNLFPVTSVKEYFGLVADHVVFCILNSPTRKIKDVINCL